MRINGFLSVECIYFFFQYFCTKIIFFLNFLMSHSHQFGQLNLKFLSQQYSLCWGVFYVFKVIIKLYINFVFPHILYFIFNTKIFLTFLNPLLFQEVGLSMVFVVEVDSKALDKRTYQILASY